MALSEASSLALARKRNMSKIDFYHVNYENLAASAKPDISDKHAFRQGISWDLLMDLWAAEKN